MIVISGDLQIAPDKEAEFLESADAVVTATCQEDGCVRYELFRHLAEPGVFHIFEEWASEEALQAHMATDHYRTFAKSLRGVGLTRADLVRYDATGKAALG